MLTVNDLSNVRVPRHGTCRLRNSRERMGAVVYEKLWHPPCLLASATAKSASLSTSSPRRLAARQPTGDPGIRAQHARRGEERRGISLTLGARMSRPRPPAAPAAAIHRAGGLAAAASARLGSRFLSARARAVQYLR